MKARLAAFRRALLLSAGLLVASPVEAQELRYEVEIEAPPPLKSLLQKHLAIHDYRESPYLTPDQFRRLAREAAAQVAEIAATEGHFSPRVTHTVEESEGTRTARFTVDPGPVSVVTEAHIEFRGHLSTADGEAAARMQKLKEGWALKPGMPFRQDAWDGSKRQILDDLLADLYPAAKIAESEARVEPDRQQVTLRAVFDSGPPHAFGELEIHGLSRYPEPVVRHLNPIRPGEPYSQARLLDLQRALQDLPYFSSVVVSADADPEHPDAVPVRVTVSETPAQKLALGVGYSTNTGARIKGRYDRYNLMRRAWRSGIYADLETRRQAAGLDFGLPTDEKGYQHRLALGAERTDLQGELLTKTFINSQRSRIRGKIEQTWSLAFQIEEQDVGIVRINNRQALSLDYSWTRRDVDNLIYPRSGTVVNLRAGGGLEALLSDADFLRLYTKAAWYRPAGRRGTLILRGEFGNTIADSRDNVPSEFLFRTGGSDTVRGYAFESLGAREGNAVVGGRYLGVASVEYLHPVAPRWDAAVFYDIGNATDDKNFTFNQGYGAGVRWHSPVGPLRLDAAYGHDVREFRVHFGVGYSF